MRGGWPLAGVLALAACPSPDAPPPLPANTIAFGVFGDGPYGRTEYARFRHLLEDVNSAELHWLLHLGDILGSQCTDAALDERLQVMNAIAHPVIYTPGDNEWTDCHPGGFRPLERLQYIRGAFFADPTRSLGATRMELETQSAGAQWSEFVENQRWRVGRVLFVTAHIVGSRNGLESFEGRTTADDEAVRRRTRASLAWIDSAFAIAGRDSLRAVVIAAHADPRFQRRGSENEAYGELLDRLERHARTFPGRILFVHGDSHEYRVDQPLPGRDNFTRLETYGSPDIGWVRVVVDTLDGVFVEFEPRLMSRLGW